MAVGQYSVVPKVATDDLLQQLARLADHASAAAQPTL
jgi:hypothetical protein